jgi:hypothetical protein
MNEADEFKSSRMSMRNKEKLLCFKFNEVIIHPELQTTILIMLYM